MIEYAIASVTLGALGLYGWLRYLPLRFPAPPTTLGPSDELLRKVQDLDNRLEAIELDKAMRGNKLKNQEDF